MSDRAESGPMQFGDDWRGVFLRGDHAGPMAGALQEALDALPVDFNPFARAMVQGLMETLASSNQWVEVEAQNLRPFKECLPASSP